MKTFDGYIATIAVTAINSAAAAAAAAATAAVAAAITAAAAIHYNTVSGSVQYQVQKLLMLVQYILLLQ